MSKNKQLAFFFALTAGIALLTFSTLNSGGHGNKIALSTLNLLFKYFPFHILDKAIIFAVRILLLYPLLFRPFILYLYKVSPMKFRFISRNFIALSNFRIFTFSLFLSFFAGIFFGIGLHQSTYYNQFLPSGYLIFGFCILLGGLLTMNFPSQFSEIRLGLKKRQFLEGFLSVMVLLTGFICIGYAILN